LRSPSSPKSCCAKSPGSSNSSNSRQPVAGVRPSREGRVPARLPYPPPRRNPHHRRRPPRCFPALARRAVHKRKPTPQVRRLPFDIACPFASIRHMPDTNPPVLMRHIEQAILVIRGHRVMISSDLAVLYGVEPKVLIQAVKRNTERFPDDFMFQLTVDEHRILKSQSVTSSWGGARRARPYAFTEQGVAMLSSVLRSTPNADAAARAQEEAHRLCHRPGRQHPRPRPSGPPEPQAVAVRSAPANCKLVTGHSGAPRAA